MNHSISNTIFPDSDLAPEHPFRAASATSGIEPDVHIPVILISLLASILSIPTAYAAGNAEAGKAAWFRTCERCHGDPTPKSKDAFSDYGTTANSLSVYASDPAAITRAANEGYIVPEGNTNDKVPVGHNTREEMGTFAGMAPDRLGYGTTPTQYAIDLSAYFASLFPTPPTPAFTSLPSVHPVAVNATPPADKVIAQTDSLPPPRPASHVAPTVTTAPVATVTAPSGFDRNGPVILRASAGDRSAKGTKSPITVSGLNNGTDYSFTVIANSSDGKSFRSAPSDTITPLAILGD